MLRRRRNSDAALALAVSPCVADTKTSPVPCASAPVKLPLTTVTPEFWKAWDSAADVATSGPVSALTVELNEPKVLVPSASLSMDGKPPNCDWATAEALTLLDRSNSVTAPCAGFCQSGQDSAAAATSPPTPPRVNTVCPMTTFSPA